MSFIALGTAALGAYSAWRASKDSSSSSDSYSQGAAEQNAFNAQQAQLNRDFQERMTKNRHKYEVDDLRNAGLNPILSATAGAAVPSGATAQGVNREAHRPAQSIAKNQLVANIASTAKDIILKDQMAKTEISKQQLNRANALKAAGTVGIPGFAQTTMHNAKQWWHSPTAKHVRNSFKKLPSSIKYWVTP